MSKTTLLIAGAAGVGVVIYFMSSRASLAGNGSSGVLNPKGPPAVPSTRFGDTINAGIDVANNVVDLWDKVTQLKSKTSGDK